MSDLIRREDVRLIALEYIRDSMERHGALEAIRALPAVQPDARIKEYEEAYQYALHLAEALRDNYPPNPDFRFLGDLIGLLTQIDNMVAGLSQSAVQPDTAPAGNLTAGGGAGQMADTPMVTGLVTSNLTARGNAATWALYDANLTRMGAVQPDPLCECGMTGPCKWTECKAPILSAHVNETPKSEHVTGDVLTPAPKGGAHD